MKRDIVRNGMRFSYLVICMLIIFSGVHAQNQGRSVARTFYSDPYFSLMDGIREASRRHAAYSFIISNFSTPGFDYQTYLPPDDRVRLQQIIPEDGDFDKKVITEFVMSAMAENSRRAQLYMTMYKGKKDSLSRIVSLGK